MAIYGNVVGGVSPFKTLILEDPSGIEITGVVTENEQILDAGPKDIMLGKTACTSDGITVGEREFLSYRTTQGVRSINPGEYCSIYLPDYDQYNYTQLQCMIAPFNTSFDDSFAVEKVVIKNGVYATGSTNKIADVTKNLETKSIDLNIINTLSTPILIYFFTYKEEQ